MDRYCNVIHSFRGKLFFHRTFNSIKKKKVKFLLLFLLGSLSREHAFSHLENTFCRPGHLCSTTIFNWYWYLSHYVTICHISVFIKTLQLLWVGICHIAISVTFQLTGHLDKEQVKLGKNCLSPLSVSIYMLMQGSVLPSLSNLSKAAFPVIADTLDSPFTLMEM